MASSMAQYFFYKGCTPSSTAEVRALLKLAFRTATATTRTFAPVRVLIRSDTHNATTINGLCQTDPHDYRVTVCVKNGNQLIDGTYDTIYGYTDVEKGMTWKRSVGAGTKPDSTLRGNGTPVWPEESELEEVPHDIIRDYQFIAQKAQNSAARTTAPIKVPHRIITQVPAKTPRTPAPTPTKNIPIRSGPPARTQPVAGRATAATTASPLKGNHTQPNAPAPKKSFFGRSTVPASSSTAKSGTKASKKK